VSNVLRICDFCGYADCPTAAQLRDRDCPQCGKRMVIENDEALDHHEEGLYDQQGREYA
jgi:hypothetical protein